MRVLISEDDRTSRLLLESLLKKWGYEVISTGDGEQAWRIMSQEPPPQMAILDWLMPKLDGLELCGRIRSTPDLQYTYIILLTGQKGIENVVAGLEAGANDYIVKPYQNNVLRARVRVGQRVIELQNDLAQNYSELQQAQKELAKRTRELERSNMELEQFAYVASHDLQEPLRGISNYLRLLERRYKDKLDSDANEFIDFAVDGASRMSNMIRDLLDYSRSGGRKRPLKKIKLQDVLDRAINNLSATVESSGAEIKFDEMPELIADRTGMVQLFQNLIGNALKFSRDRRPEIVVSANNRSDHWIFAVADNGIGIESSGLKRIFNVFERLHTRQDYDGTGLGLSICKKIVERHGGRIWVESEKDVGSTFYFTLSHNPPDDGKED